MLTFDEGAYAVRLARNTLEDCINKTSTEMDEPSKEFKEARGVFVTLQKKEGLRGCIGYPLPISPLYSAIVDSAINAATRDPRFLPVKSDELNDIIVEVTVLTPPEVIEVEPKDLPDNIEIGRHGLIVKRGQYQGLLLPQVPIEHGMDVEDFLSHTCMKAGLSPVAWLEEGTEVSRFEGQIFEEVEPNGDIVEKKLS
ncbi:MAG: TIGR00296 family protein [Halobacteriota archaeon]|nr:TIGR00296 family protein [Halobacteriota archaeon]